jgi:immunomodulating metalloprotease
MRTLFFSLLTIVLATACDGLGVECPEGASKDDDGVCACDEGRYGSVDLDEDLGAYAGVCRTGLEEAIRTGDPATLETEAEILSEARDEAARIIDLNRGLLRGIYGSDSIVYTPGLQSHHILSTRPEDTFVLVQGSEAGHSLAAIGEQDEGRVAGFGFNIVGTLAAGDQNAYRSPFDRLVTWMLTGSPGDVVPPDASVAVAGLGGGQGDVASWLGEYSWDVDSCEEADVADCFTERDLIVVGASGSNEGAEAMGDATRAAMRAGTAVLFVNTQNWQGSASGTAVLTELGMAYGPYGGNFWSEDRADWDSVEDMLDQGGVLGSLDALLGHFQAQDFDFDWSLCTTSVGHTKCGDVPGLRNEFLNGAEALKGMLAELDKGGMDLFDVSGRRLSKLCVLLADYYRARIEYPLSKTDEDILPFLRAYYADHVVHYRRDVSPAQPDLGSFSGPVLAVEVGQQDATVAIDVTRYGGFTAVGYYALPGEPVIVRLLSGEDLNPKIHINTQRTGSTREFNDGLYDRPKFLSSPKMALARDQDIELVTPYGGTLQITVDSAAGDGVVELELSGVGQHAVLHPGGDLDAYLETLAGSQFPFTEITNPYVQVHSKSDMMLTAIDNYGGDLEAFFADVDLYMVQDTYDLAGFVGDGLEPVPEVLDTCDALGWDCLDGNIHGRPAVQHINVDTYAHCGGGCSGNPYDQSWPLGPLGWGETHEIGHNLQRGRLRIYDGRSGEVSNQIFPLHKHWAWKLDTGESLTPDRVDYRGVFDLFQASVGSEDPVGDAYADIWEDSSYAADNGKRMGLWMQMRHFAASLDQWETGWDIFTLMYLHHRLFGAAVGDEAAWAAQRDGLGFDIYPDAGDIGGNDFMLLSYSFLTETDHRPFFDLWGVDYSQAAVDQLDAYGFPPVPQQMWVSDDVNDDPHPTPVAIDGVSEWPLPER